MNLDLPQVSLERQEIRCSDCRHVYSIVQGLKSGRCPECGNIEFFSQQVAPAKVLVRPATVIARSAAVEEFLKDSPFATAIGPANHLEIQSILRRYDNEWQLWSALTLHFRWAEYHNAYLSFCARNHCIDKACARYLAHQKIFAPIADESWQAEAAEQMISRAQTLAIVQWERSEGLKPWLKSGPYRDKTLWTFLWVVVGFILAAVAVGRLV
jgi:hypothetical protein